MHQTPKSTSPHAGSFHLVLPLLPLFYPFNFKFDFYWYFLFLPFFLIIFLYPNTVLFKFISPYLLAIFLRRLGKGAYFPKCTPPVACTGDQCFGSAWIRNPDPYLESGSGFQIQMSKNRFKKLKFTMTDFEDKNRKMLRLRWNFNHNFLSLFQELSTLEWKSETLRRFSWSEIAQIFEYLPAY
jgi:hypothetical protein